MIVMYREKNRKRERRREKKGGGDRKIREIIAYLKQKYITLNVVKATFSLQLSPSKTYSLERKQLK